MLDVESYGLNYLETFFIMLMYFITNRCHDFNNCKDLKALLFAFKDEFRNLFFIDIHEIFWSVFECIEANSYFKAAIKKSPLMEIALLASMRIEVGFNHGPSINGINFMIVCRYCGKNVFKDLEDDYDEGFVSSLVLLRMQYCHCQ